MCNEHKKLGGYKRIKTAYWTLNENFDESLKQRNCREFQRSSQIRWWSHSIQILFGYPLSCWEVVEFVEKYC